MPEAVSAPAPHPSGIVTFLFTDVEGSTRLWAADTEATARSLEIHDELIKGAVESRGGYVFGWAGDHFRAAFQEADVAVDAAMAVQQALFEIDWRDGPRLRVRMGIHRGRATQREGDYFGPVPNIAARLEALASGGQILISDEVLGAVDVKVLSLGQHRLRDVPDPMNVHQVGIDSFRPLEVIDPALCTLPNPGSAIIGRRADVAQVSQLLELYPMVTLTGPGGCGKTRLAVEVAYQELPSRADGCYFADLSSVSDGSELAAALASAVLLEIGGADPLDQVVAHLAVRNALLLLDNCEHILDDCAEFAERLLARSNSTAILATTRQRLDVAGEQVVAVGSLDDGSGDGPAVELFIERARAVSPGFQCEDLDRVVVAKICSHLDGMPLPIELAAARIAVLTPQEILDRMGDRFRLLSGGRGRHKRRTLQATLDWSYDLLDEDEQLFFRRCGLFVGSFDLPAAVAVAGFSDYDAIDLLESLVAKSLIALEDTRSNETTRYHLLETIRIYACDQLARSEEVSAGRDAHLAHFRSMAEPDGFGTATCLRRADRLRNDWPNIAAALEWLMVNDDAEGAARVAFGCQGLWESQIPAIEGRRWIDQILDELKPGENRDWMLYVDAVLAMQLDDFPATHRLLRDLIDDSALLPRIQAVGLFAFLCCRQFPDEAVELIALGKQLVNDNNLGGEYLRPTVWSEGCLALYEHRYDDALPCFERAFGLGRDRGLLMSHQVMAGLSFAAAQVLTGESAGALKTLDSTDWSSSIWDSSPIIRALAMVDVGRSAEAADLVVGFGYDALRGRLNRMANDALVGLAALAINRGEAERGWTLLQQAASPRTPFTIVLAEALAARVGHGDEMRRIHRERDTPLIAMDAGRHLRTELDRIRTAR